ncbi:Redoxin domain protein [Pseudopedobacter saltans DSM 12145]|uniref:Redoxin domain protein n=1 Tax=Pseudopedobacter saltans (strain ATCC 51119 / DSM 12145 / JCM 21818 / CCUG 39354 / LMG 10337 / NBRC 100064 / NCIMB 13643) TaxID=762903 RepID=F0S8E0_PSESL|nr:TlpA disulfide reductase family protein [Pseudopedobacter saltans]ADY53404.1 Redoxin domain protein [Pseudopedobacter saltans DSM 12145]
MKKLQIFLIAIYVFLSFNGFSQTTRIPLSEKSVVKDSTGLVYTYENWSSLIKTGEYKLVKSKMGNDEYLIIGRENVNDNENKQIYRGNSANFVGKKIKFPYMTDLQGRDYWNDILKDKVVVLNFWFVKCAPCKAEIPLLNELYWKYSERENVVFLAVCLDNGGMISEFMKTTPFVYKQVPSGIEIARKFNIAGYPTNLIIDKGVVKYGTTGFTKANIQKAEEILNQCL